MSSLQPALPIAADTEAMRHVLRRADVAHGSQMLVTGPAGLTAVIWLYRHGYPRAIYIPEGRVAGTAAPGDALLIPHACPAEELADVLGDGGCVRDGGVLIVQAPDIRTGELETLPAVMERTGFAVETQIASRGHAVYVARRAGGVRRAA
jgi:hypothetical protein